ncbi:MAG: glycosyltransferase [Nitrospirae bacterium]|nr:MAG: glycosyltransferase [Nitrospirota bacterium]
MKNKRNNPSISLIIPVLNEAESINCVLEHLFSLRYGGILEIIVVDGADDHGTLNAIKYPGVRKLASTNGRARQMNRGASEAKGEVLLFLHSDTELPEDGLELIADTVFGGYRCGAFELGIASKRHIYRVIETIVRIRTRLTMIPYGDQAIFVTKSFFDSFGGYTEIPLMEDVDIMRKVRRNGEKICVIERQVKTSARRWEKEGVLYCILRNWVLLTLYLIGVSPERLVKYYSPHRPLSRAQ